MDSSAFIGEITNVDESLYRRSSSNFDFFTASLSLICQPIRSFFARHAYMSPTFLKVRSSLCSKVIPNRDSIATMSMAWDRESQPSTSSAVVWASIEMSSLSKTLQNTALDPSRDPCHCPTIPFRMSRGHRPVDQGIGLSALFAESCLRCSLAGNSQRQFLSASRLSTPDC